MYKHYFVATLWFCLGLPSFAQVTADPLADFPKGSTPQEVGKRVAENLLSRPYMTTRFMNNRGSIHYAEICTAYGALRFADVTKDKDLLDRLEQRYLPIINEPDTPLIPVGSHGDFTVFALVPFELYRLRGDKRFLDLGTKLVTDQWKVTNPTDGLTLQARWWIDDVYMISSVDSLATRVTGNPVHVDHAAHFIEAYFSKMQRDDGLLPHTLEAPQIWGRGVGWAAAGLVEALKTLPQDHPRRAVLMGYYKKLMAGLLACQAPGGLWRQLVDKPDAWEETSCTGMFAYAMIVGVRNGWLDRDTYGSAARRAWLALVTKLDDKGEMTDVCIGTNQETGDNAYLKRPRRTGDFHGQAPMMWCADALLR